jgi:hypothetical protein
VEPCYSQVADQQLNELERSGNIQLYRDVVTVCAFILDNPESAQSRLSAITTEQGNRFRYAVPGHPPYEVFCSSDGPRIEAVVPPP